jgi:uncharacterized DUF497 family protein
MTTWDEKKRRGNLSKHGLDLSDGVAVFDGPVFTAEDTRERYGEPRWKTLGLLGTRVVVMVWTDRETGPHIISLRYGDKRETRNFFQNLQP